MLSIEPAVLSSVTGGAKATTRAALARYNQSVALAEIRSAVKPSTWSTAQCFGLLLGQIRRSSAE